MTDPTHAASPANLLRGDAALVRAVGFIALTAAVINVTVGGGIFRAPSAVAASMGTAAPLAFLAGALAIVPIALCFAAAGSRVSATGGPYTYTEAAFGPFAGFVAGALMWITNVASSGAIASALFDQVATAFPVLRTGTTRVVFLLALYAVLIALNAFGVKLGARAIVVLATVKLTPLYILAAVGLFFVDWGQVTWTIPSWPALGTSMVLVLFAYSGLETALIPSAEVKDPSRDVPRATLAAIAMVVLLYLGIQIVCQGVLGPALATAGAPVASAAGALWSPGFGLLIATASASMFGFMLGNLLGSSRLLFALARDGFLPSPLARVTASYRVPLLAIIAHGGLGCALALAGSFEILAILSGGANAMVYVMVCIAAWRLQRSGRADHGNAFVLPGGPLIPLLSLAAMGAILYTLKPEEWTAIGIALGALVVIYGVLRGLRSRTPAN
jgi:amino acid transporter